MLNVSKDDYFCDYNYNFTPTMSISISPRNQMLLVSLYNEKSRLWGDYKGIRKVDNTDSTLIR